MKFGQMSIQKISPVADFLQLDICGLDTEQTLNRYHKYQSKIPVILHGDWSKNNVSENDILKRERVEEYKKIINTMKQEAVVHALTLHPPYRSKINFASFLEIVKEIEADTKTPVLVENRSNQRIWISQPKEIIEFSKIHPMTIDIPQLYIGCNYDKEEFLYVIKALNMENVKEVHLANLVVKNRYTFVARKIEDGIIDLSDLSRVMRKFNHNTFVTFEILGGVQTFEQQREMLIDMIS